MVLRPSAATCKCRDDTDKQHSDSSAGDVDPDVSDGRAAARENLDRFVEERGQNSGQDRPRDASFAEPARKQRERNTQGTELRQMREFPNEMQRDVLLADEKRKDGTDQFHDAAAFLAGRVLIRKRFGKDKEHNRDDEEGAPQNMRAALFVLFFLHAVPLFRTSDIRRLGNSLPLYETVMPRWAAVVFYCDIGDKICQDILSNEN